MNAKQRRKHRRETVGWLQITPGDKKPFRLTREIVEASRYREGDFINIPGFALVPADALKWAMQ